MAGIEIGSRVYRIVTLSPDRARLEIHSALVDLIHVYPKHSILSLDYDDTGGRIDITLLNGNTVCIVIPAKPTGERDTRSIPKLKKLFAELSDMIS